MAVKRALHLFLASAMLMCFAGNAHADNLEYRYEVGVMAGGSSYYGDTGNSQ